MTTAEFIIGHSADDAVERKREVRKIFWALLAAVFIHLLIGAGLAVSNGLFSSALPAVEEDKPMEMTFVDLPTQNKKNTMFVQNDEKNVPAPAEKTFESNANSIAASAQPATGSMPLPSQEGKDRPNMDLDSHAASLANEGAQPQPSAAKQPTVEPSVAPTPQSTPLPDQFAMLTSTPRPTAQPTAASTPQQPKSVYQPMKDRTRLAGSISNRGTSSVNALGTPLGRYQKMIYDAVGSRWYNYVQQKGDLVDLGTAHVVFSVDRTGRVKNLKLVHNTSNEVFANVCLQSVLEIQLPPIPEDVASTLPSEGLDQEISFTMFPN